jgi:hypothetical protein
MCTVSLTLHKTMIMTVHNQYPDIELISPVYFCNRGKRYRYRIKRVHDNVLMKIGFRFDFDQDVPRGILMYTIRRKSNIRSDHQSSVDTISTKVIEEALKMTRLLVTWKIEHLKEPKVNIILVEHDNELVLNEDKLTRLCEKVNNILSGRNSSVWLMCGNTALTVTHEVVRKTGLELKITVSQGVGNLDAIRPMYIDSER